MASRRDATLNLSRLLNHAPGAESDVVGEGLLEPDEALLETDGLRLTEPLRWSLRVSGSGGDDDLLVEGEVAGVSVMECRRCLTEVPTEVRTRFIYPAAYRPGDVALDLVEGDDDEDDVLVFGKPEVDFAPLLTQLYAIDQPITVLCQESCRGLSIDGVNLNEHPDHQPQEAPRAASPFAELEDLDLP